MSEALDAFLIDGIQHNIPFLSALMQHPRWREGRLTTGFIDEEYPDGFNEVAPTGDIRTALAAASLSMDLLHRDRLDRLPGRLRPHSGDVRMAWVVKIGDEQVPVNLIAGLPMLPIDLDLEIDGRTVHVESGWTPGDPLWFGSVDGTDRAIQVRRAMPGYVLSTAGVTASVEVMTPRIAELDALMPVKQAADTSKLLLCPMPGLVVSINVAEGQEVKAGETLAVIEAMKMENVLRAERDVTVSSIGAAPGDSLAVDAVIMEFS